MLYFLFVSMQHKDNGVMPRRDELFIKTHTHKNGLPSQAAAHKIVSILKNSTLMSKGLMCRGL